MLTLLIMVFAALAWLSARREWARDAITDPVVRFGVLIPHTLLYAILAVPTYAAAHYVIKYW